MVDSAGFDYMSIRWSFGLRSTGVIMVRDVATGEANSDGLWSSDLDEIFLRGRLSMRIRKAPSLAIVEASPTLSSRIISKSFDLEPVSSRRTVQDEVYQRLSDALISGGLEPGHQLTIGAIANMCKTSHMPVREALRRLAAENALEIASTGSAYVPAVTRARLDDLCDARIINESAAGEKAVQFATAPMIREMERAISDFYVAARDHDLAGMAAKNQQFHFTLYRASNSPVLVRVIETLWLQFGPFLRLLTREVEPSLREPDTYTKHHIDIIQAVKNADGKSVAQCVAADIKATRSVLRGFCDAEDEAARDAPATSSRSRRRR